MNKKGFTLLELIVVLAILGVLSLIVLTNFNSTIEEATGARCVTDKQELANSYNREILLNSTVDPDVLLIEVLSNADHKYFNKDSQCAKQGHLFPIYNSMNHLVGFMCSDHDKTNPALHNAVGNKVMRDYHKIYLDYTNGKITLDELKRQSNLYVQQYYETIYGGFPTLTIGTDSYEVYPYIKNFDEKNVPISINLSDVIIYAKKEGTGISDDYYTNYVYRLSPGSKNHGVWYRSNDQLDISQITNEEINALISKRELKKVSEADVIY